METEQARVALAAMDDAKARLAAASDCPPQGSLAFAGLMGAAVAVQAAPPADILALYAVLALVAGGFALWRRRRTGVFINGYRQGRTRPIALALVAGYLLFYTLGCWLKTAYGLWPAPLACGLATALFAWFGSRAWNRTFARELKAAA